MAGIAEAGAGNVAERLAGGIAAVVAGATAVDDHLCMIDARQRQPTGGGVAGVA